MNEEDKGLISRYLWGRCLMQMRQWMVEHFSRRYRGLHYDGSSDSWTEGYWVTGWKWVFGDMDRSLNNVSKRSWFRIKRANLTIKEYEEELQARRDGTSTMSNAAFKSLEHKAKLAKIRKGNLVRLSADLLMTTLLLILAHGVFPPPEETEGESYGFRLFNYFLHRSAAEALSATPVGAVLETKSVYKNPAYITSTINGLSYPVYGLILGDHLEDYQRGPHKDENKYKVRILKYTVPFYKDYDKLKHLQENSDIFMPFDPTYQFLLKGKN
jgi:hypothetical protein